LLDRDVLHLGLELRLVEPLQVPVDHRAHGEQQLALKGGELLLELLWHGPPERLEDRDQRGQVGYPAGTWVTARTARAVARRLVARPALPVRRGFGPLCVVSPLLVHPRPSRTGRSATHPRTARTAGGRRTARTAG